VIGQAYVCANLLFFLFSFASPSPSGQENWWCIFLHFVDSPFKKWTGTQIGDCLHSFEFFHFSIILL